MKMKKFEGKNEKAVVAKAMAELGSDAIVMNVKSVPARGFLAFLRKPRVEVTMAYDEAALGETEAGAEAEAIAEAVSNAEGEPDAFSEGKAFTTALKDITIAEQRQRIAELEAQLSDTAEARRQLEERLRVAASTAQTARRYRSDAVQALYDVLMENGVKDDIAADMLDELDGVADGAELTLLVKIVYHMLVEAIGVAPPMSREPAERGNPRVAVFLGSTGVGKTTTIAKLAAGLMLDSELQIGLLTADTYRIAAVEQLKTYADILDVEVGVAYLPEEVAELAQTFGETHDVVMLDTTGRSPRNAEAMAELSRYVQAAGDCERYLLLSLATRWEDMLEIVQAYEAMGEFTLIFTKSDEAGNLGAVLNVCKLTGKRAAYITYGQNVPEDIKPLDAAEIARALLGL